MYSYNKDTLQFNKIQWYKTFTFVSITIGIFLVSTSITIDRLDEQAIESKVLVIMSKQNQFDKDKLIDRIKEMHFMFPHIVYAQAILETNSFTSAIFKENNNLFGMKEANVRITISKGTQNNHAIYNSWLESVYDYGYYQATYLSKLKIEDDYFSYLGQYYAEDNMYVSNIKTIIKRDRLKELFN